jgi:hypothetical protein
VHGDCPHHLRRLGEPTVGFRGVLTIWVGRLSISTKVARKIIDDHEITPDEVRDAVQCRRGLVAARNVHPTRGERFIVETSIRSRPALVVLYGRDDPLGDSWNLGSAYFTDT